MEKVVLVLLIGEVNFNTQYFADPEENIIGVLMKQTQDISNDDTGWKFRQLVGQAIDD